MLAPAGIAWIVVAFAPADPAAQETAGSSPERDLSSRVAAAQELLAEANRARECGDRSEQKRMALAGIAVAPLLDATSSEECAQLTWDLGKRLYETDENDAALRAWIACLAWRTQHLPIADELAMNARRNLAQALERAGDRADALLLYDEGLGIADAQGTKERWVAQMRFVRGEMCLRGGDLDGAAEQVERAIAELAGLAPPDDPELARWRVSLAWMARRREDPERSLALLREALASFERMDPPPETDLLGARRDLALTLVTLERHREARPYQEAVVAVLARDRPADSRDLLSARRSLAGILLRTGEPARARREFEDVLARQEQTLPAEDPDLLDTRQGLAVTMLESGDVAAARAVMEELLVIRNRTLPVEDRNRLIALQNVGAVALKLGDAERARAIFEEILAVRRRTLPAGHPDLWSAEYELALTLAQLGRLDAAGKTLAELARDLPPPTERAGLDARANLAAVLCRSGDLAAGRALQEEVILHRERQTEPSRFALRIDKSNLGNTMRLMGDYAAARALLEGELARDPVAAADESELMYVRENLAVTLAAMGDAQALAPVVRDLTRDLEAVLRPDPSGSSREAVEVGAFHARRLACLLSLAPLAGKETERATFAIVESLRAQAGRSPRLDALAERPEFRELRRSLLDARARVGDLAAARSEVGAPAAERVLAVAVEERDRIEVELRRAAQRGGALAAAVDVDGVARGLAADAAAVAYVGFPMTALGSAADPSIPRSQRVLLAHVVLPDGALLRVELGSLAEIQELVRAWRTAVGRPLERGRAASAAPEADEVRAGSTLRARVLDPVLRAIAAHGAPPRTLHLALDDCLHLVPLDALPAERGLVGDGLELRFESSLARLVEPPRPPAPDGALVAFGGLDFDAAGDAAPRAVEAALAVGKSERSGPDGIAFNPLRETRYEVENIAELCAKARSGEAIVLEGARGTKAALIELAPRARWLHVATHGYFADESLRSLADPGAADDAPARRDALAGLAPMALCGLALAGGNAGPDASGRVAGILTAEELAGLDLSNCELAVLSACETTVGITRAGQGIQSLQSALQTAGARTVVTSLWKVDDESTRDLMVDFYRRLWIEKKPKAQALWEAKRALRAKGHATRDWAGWVLTGAPD